MKQLHPRSVWLMAISSTLGLFFLLGFFTVFFSFMFMNDVEIDIPKDNFLETLIFFAIVFVIFLFIVFVISFIKAKLTYHFYFYELGKDSFNKESGIIWKKYVSIPYERIQNVDIYRGLVARLLGLSEIRIQTAGASATVSNGGVVGAGAEGRLYGITHAEAMQMREELIKRAKNKNSL